MFSSIKIGILVLIVLILAACASGISPRRIVFERGSRGVVPCPAMVDRGYSASDTEAIYWSFLPEGSSHSPESIITYFHGVTTHQSSNTERYDIQDTSLVITNVTWSVAGTYSYRYKTWYKAPKDGSVEVSEKVSCKSKLPKVSLYIDDQPSWEGTDSSGTVKVPSDTADLNLTCRVEHTKPAVNISWSVWFPVLNKWKEIQGTRQIERAPCETECFFVDGTFNSKVTVNTLLESNNLIFKCEANNSELKPFEVTIVKTNNDTVTADPQEVTDRDSFGLGEPTPMTNCTCSMSILTILLIAMSLSVNLVLLVIILCLRRRRLLKQLEKNSRHHVLSQMG